MTKDKKIILITSIAIGLIVIVSFVLTGFKLYSNWQEKNSSGQLYIVIKQYAVEDEHFKVGDKGVILFEAVFTDELYYKKTIETEYGYNTILIENGKAQVIDADCPNPHSLNGCMNGVITNDESFLDIALIRCMQHGISIGWEVR